MRRDDNYTRRNQNHTRTDQISSRRRDISLRTNQKSSWRNDKSKRRNQKSLRRDDKSKRTNEISLRRNDTFVSKIGLFSNGNINYVRNLTGSLAGQADSCVCPFMGQIGSSVPHGLISRLREGFLPARDGKPDCSGNFNSTRRVFIVSLHALCHPTIFYWRRRRR